jgi:hypothetical protein
MVAFGIGAISIISGSPAEAAAMLKKIAPLTVLVPLVGFGAVLIWEMGLEGGGQRRFYRDRLVPLFKLVGIVWITVTQLPAAFLDGFVDAREPTEAGTLFPVIAEFTVSSSPNSLLFWLVVSGLWLVLVQTVAYMVARRVSRVRIRDLTLSAQAAVRGDLRLRFKLMRFRATAGIFGTLAEAVHRFTDQTDKLIQALRAETELLREQSESEVRKAITSQLPRYRLITSDHGLRELMVRTFASDGDGVAEIVDQIHRDAAEATDTDQIHLNPAAYASELVSTISRFAQEATRPIRSVTVDDELKALDERERRLALDQLQKHARPWWVVGGGPAGSSTQTETHVVALPAEMSMPTEGGFAEADGEVRLASKDTLAVVRSAQGLPLFALSSIEELRRSYRSLPETVQRGFHSRIAWAILLHWVLTPSPQASPYLRTLVSGRVLELIVNISDGVLEIRLPGEDTFQLPMTELAVSSEVLERLDNSIADLWERLDSREIRNMIEEFIEELVSRDGAGDLSDGERKALAEIYVST